MRASLETGACDRTSFLVEQNDIRLLLTSPLEPRSEIANQISHHGDGVKDIAFRVDNAGDVFEQAVSAGARPVLEPLIIEDQRGRIVKATVAACGDTVHSFVEREEHEGAFMPHFQPVTDAPPALPIGVGEIDHVAISVEAGRLDQWVEYYERVFGFHQSHSDDVTTEYSGMNSRVVQDKTGRIKFPLMEPSTGRRKSQIEEFLSFYQGPGAQHIALSSQDIGSTVRALRGNGIELLRTPDTYYDQLEKRIGMIDEDPEMMRELSILADRDGWGYLMQVFSKPVGTRPTLFWEIIQRKGAKGFGSGNVRSLFEAVEREQALRGTL